MDKNDINETHKDTKSYNPHTKADVMPVYYDELRLKHYPDTVPNPNILFYTAGTGKRVDTVRFYKMLVRKDAQFRTVINIRKQAVANADWKITAGDNSDFAEMLADFVRKNLTDGIDSFREILFQMTDAIITGYNIHEILTDIDENGNEVITDLVYLNADRFEFGTDGELYLCSSMLKPKRKQLDKRNFMIHTNEATNENPYGESVLGEASFWLYYLKNGNWKDWAQFNERFGQGILKGEYDRGNIKAMEQTFEALSKLRSNGYAVFEKGSNVEILEASRNTGDYQLFLNEIDKAIAKMVLGQELTTSTGNGSGSYSLGKVHQNTFDRIVLSDRHNIEETINKLIRNIIKRTYKGSIPFPKFCFINENITDIGKQE